MVDLVVDEAGETAVVHGGHGLAGKDRGLDCDLQWAAWASTIAGWLLTTTVIAGLTRRLAHSGH